MCEAQDNLGEGEGMSVPDVFPGFTPEEKAASALLTLFTMVALKIVMAQWVGSRHRSPMYNKMVAYVEENPVNGTTFLSEMMRHEELDFRLAAVRIVEVRQAYAKSAFDWEDMRIVALAGVEKDSREMLNSYMSMSFDLGSDDEAD